MCVAANLFQFAETQEGNAEKGKAADLDSVFTQKKQTLKIPS
jgi:hypothetical protein